MAVMGEERLSNPDDIMIVRGGTVDLQCGAYLRTCVFLRRSTGSGAVPALQLVSRLFPCHRGFEFADGGGERDTHWLLHCAAERCGPCLSGIISRSTAHGRSKPESCGRLGEEWLHAGDQMEWMSSRVEGKWFLHAQG